MSPSLHRACCVFELRQGTLRTAEALRAGFHPRTLYALRDRGEVEQIARGLFRLKQTEPLGEPDLITVAKKVPRAVFCLLTALAFHRLTTQVPHVVAIALPRTARTPRALAHLPLEVFRFSPASLHAGIETHTVDGEPIRIYSAEKTRADGFKHRRRLGTDVAVEALRTYRDSRRRHHWQHMLEYARVCRVGEVMRPYLETVV